MAERNQSGLAHDYTEWVAESTVGEVPADPAWNPFSDNVRTVWDGEPDASTEAQRGLGDRDPRGFYNGPEEHEFTFVYDLQQWYVDSNGNVQDPAGSIVQDTADNDVPATHSVVSKESHVEGGADSGGRYIFTVGKGGYPSELTVPFETEDGLPIQQEFTYRFEKVREYDISQPSGTPTLGVKSTSANDTSQSVTIEDDSGTSETISLNGTTFVESTNSYGSIAAFELDAETEGDIKLGISDGATTPSLATQLSVVHGKNAYGGAEGDLGVPATGAGSHSGTIGSDYIRFREDILHYETDGDIAPQVLSGELTIDAGIDATGRAHTTRQSIDVGQRETTLTAGLAGPKPSVTQMQEYVQEVTHNIEWIPNTSTAHNLVLQNSQMTTPGTIARESDSTKLIVESEWMSENVTVS